jgi:hypothetical protein
MHFRRGTIFPIFTEVSIYLYLRILTNKYVPQVIRFLLHVERSH